LNTSRLSIQDFEKGIRAGDRVILAKAITLVESTLAEDQMLANMLLNNLLPETGNSMRVGITGVPGVGKSTFIEAIGKHVIANGKKLAILTIDPSSQLTRGSILGDKTRMNELSKNPAAFIRPTAASNVLGGVASRTREAMLLCEAAGYDVIFIETVGVGQSEISVKSMVDFFLLLMLAGAGDELQGIKKGIMEMADAVVITKADGDNVSKASEAMAEYQHALHLFSESKSGWTPVVKTSSSYTGTGIEDVWNIILDHHKKTLQTGHWNENRSLQNKTWFTEYFYRLLMTDFQSFESVQHKMEKLKTAVVENRISPPMAAKELLEAYHLAVKK
jgi:LAO/AO transport system kinase